MKSLLNKSTITLLGLSSLGASLAAAPLMMLGENVEFFVNGKAGLEYQDNVYLNSNNEVSDVAFNFTPGVEFRVADRGAASAVLTYDHLFKIYDDEGELDGDYSNLAFRANYDSGVFLGQFNASYRELASNSAADSPDVDGRLAERSERRIGGTAKYQVSELTAFSVGLNNEETKWDDVNGQDIYTDFESTGLPITAFYRIRPQLDLTAGYRYRVTNTDVPVIQRLMGQGDLEYKDHYYFVGAVGEVLSPLLTADVNIGYQDRQYQDAPSHFNDPSTVSYNGTLRYAADARTTYHFSLSRDFRTSASRGSAYNLSKATVGGNYQMTESFSSSAALTYGESVYEDSPREEDLLYLTLGAAYNPNDYLTLRANYRYSDVDGNGQGGASDYTSNRISVSASVRY